MKKFVYYLLIAIFVVFAGVFFFIKNFNKKPLPDYNQNINLRNLTSEVTVFRDENGIPHIYADNEEDLYRAAGYVTAQDRLWQMDLIRRATQGRLSEIFGKDLFDIDLMLRSLQIDQKSQMLYEKLPDDQKNALIAYADGVNQFIEQNKNKLPIEFKLLKYQPDAWQPQNSLNIIGYIAWDLATAWGNEITLFEIQQKLDSALWTQFVPDFDNEATIYDLIDIDTPLLDNTIEKTGMFINDLGIVPFMGSNNWAVSGKKSTTGMPILCNDMHLSFGIPGIWYQMHLVVDGKLNVTGLNIPGAPGIVAGHNDSIAWGMTNVMLDGSDFYVETLNDDSTEYFCDGKWLKLRIDTVKIATKEGDTLTGYLRFTHRGPIISKFKNINKVVSMHWIGNEYSNEFQGVYMLNRSNNWQDFREACKRFGAVAQNIIYADTKGNIGLQLTGLIAKRKIPGYFVLPGDTTEYDWTGFVSFDSLPFVYNPECGYIISANNKSSNNVDYYISQYFYQDYRYRRIKEMLTEKDKLSVEDMEKIQADQHSILVKDILTDQIFELGRLNVDDGKYQKIMSYLNNWDGDMNKNSVAAMFFEQFNIFLVKNTVEDELGKDLYAKFEKSKILMNNMLVNILKNKDTQLYDNVNTDKKEDIKDIFLISYQQTVDTLTKQLGNNPDNWQYGKLHTLTLEHPLAKVKILDRLFGLNKGPYAVGGSNHTVSPYAYPFASNFKVNHGASHRHIFPTDNWENSKTIIPTGESGIPASPFYCDQTERYLNNIYHNDYYAKQNVEKNAKFTMKFIPEK